ncbi:hypothetical protein D3C85_1760760 [compost metagenome]
MAYIHTIAKAFPVEMSRNFMPTFTNNISIVIYEDRFSVKNIGIIAQFGKILNAVEIIDLISGI